MFSARIYLAFVFAEAANYLSQLHVNKSVHNQRTKRVHQWMKQNNFPGRLVERVDEYHQMLWDDFQGINEHQILSDLPESLRHEVRSHMLSNLLLNWEAFPKQNTLTGFAPEEDPLRRQLQVFADVSHGSQLVSSGPRRLSRRMYVVPND